MQEKRIAEFPWIQGPDPEALAKIDRILAEAEGYRAYMNRFRFVDSEAKERSCRLKSGMSTGITALLITRNLTRLYGQNYLSKLPKSTLGLVHQAIRNIKKAHLELLRENFPEEIERMKGEN